MITMLLLFITLPVMSMNNDTKIDIEKSENIQSSQEAIRCECKMCKGTKITIATNIVSIALTAAATALINYSACNK